VFDLAERDIAELLARSELHVFESFDFGKPRFLVLSPDHGLIALDIDSDETTEATLKALNGKIDSLLDDLPELQAVKISRVVIRKSPKTNDSRFYISSAELENTSWLSKLNGSPIERSLFEGLKLALAPEATVRVPSRTAVSDDGLVERNMKRIQLDTIQASIALRKVKRVLVIEGPAGSGKSLVLAARARWLSSEHPDWRIRIVCFNQGLTSYFDSLVAGCPNVTVETIWQYANRIGHRVSFESSQQAEKDYEMAEVKGIPLDADAVLVDESQDFFTAWFKFLNASLFPGRGGFVIAGDDSQALYRDSYIGDAFDDDDIEVAYLAQPYRSTRQILDVAAALEPAYAIDEREYALEGAAVEVIWAENLTEQSRAIAFDFAVLEQVGYAWFDMGILVSHRYMMKAVAGALIDRNIPFNTVSRSEAGSMDMHENKVKVMTYHAAKGLEFGVVALFGLDQLKDPHEIGIDETEREERRRRERLCLVGPTRAKDLLYITYTKSNRYIDQLVGSEADHRAWVWPDDYGMDA
jgi:hypothetical protein